MSIQNMLETEEPDEFQERVTKFRQEMQRLDQQMDQIYPIINEVGYFFML